jgi:hypothetical protein
VSIHHLLQSARLEQSHRASNFFHIPDVKYFTPGQDVQRLPDIFD